MTLVQNVLITGGTGFIGSHLAERLLAEGRRVRVLSLPKPSEPLEADTRKVLEGQGAEVAIGDLRDVDTLRPALKGVDTVFHLGGISRPMRVLKREYYDNSVLGTQNILEASHAADVSKFVHVSSVSVLGVSPDGHPLKEDEFQEEDCDYGISKLQGERIALNYHRNQDFPVVVIRPCLVHGPRCLVRLILFRFIKWGVFPLFNGGSAQMEFGYVDNVVDSLLLAEQNDEAVGDVFNITDGRSYTIKEVLDTIAEELGVRPPSLRLPVAVGKLAGRASEFVSALVGVHPPFSRSAASWMSRSQNVYDCSHARERLSYDPRISLREGVRRSIEWYRERGLL